VTNEKLQKIIQKAQGSTIREYIFDQYIIIYAENRGKVNLLSIKHHNQLSFDFYEHWID
jgi:hypothetical protein